MKKERKSNIELLRIIAMLLIVAFHCNNNFGFNQSNIYDRILMLITGIWGVLGVDCFFIISFNFLHDSKLKSKKLFHLILQILFYAIPLSIISTIYIKNATGLNLFTIMSKNLISGINNPFWHDVYWFATIYMLIYLTFPILNKVLKRISQKQLKNLTIILTVMIFLYQTKETVIEDYFFAMYIYIFLYYIKKNKENWVKENCVWGAITATIAIILSRVILDNPENPEYINTIIKVITGGLNRHSLLILADALFIFYIFKGLNIKQSKIINTISSTTFGIYLFHANQVLSLRSVLYYYLVEDVLKVENINSEWYVSLVYISEVLILFIAGIIVDLIRQRIFEKIINQKIDKKLERYYEKIDKCMNCE